MNASRTSLCAAVSGALLFAAPALAQESEEASEPEASEDSIVVTGDRERPTSREVSRQARDISDITSDIYDKPLARIEDRLCPGIIGLKQDYAAFMIDRIRWNAERLEMWMADDTACDPNLIIAFVDDGKAELARLHENQPWLFDTLTIPERERLLATEGPVRVWTTAQVRTRDGMPIQRRESLDAPPVVSMWMAHSKLYLTIREDITQVVVLFDRERVRGKTLIQLADYATMRSFARTRPAEGDAPLDTILALFDPADEPPNGLTEFDQAYLRSIYEGIANLPAATKLLGVNREIGQLVEEEDARSAE
jgi:hypothetical protein